MVRELVPVMLSRAARKTKRQFCLARLAGRCFPRHAAEHPLGAALWRGADQRRAIGEFGAVSVVSGSIRGENFRCRYRLNCLSRTTTPSAPYRCRVVDADGDYHPVFKEYVQWRLENQEKRAQQEEHHEH